MPAAEVADSEQAVAEVETAPDLAVEAGRPPAVEVDKLLVFEVGKFRVAAYFQECTNAVSYYDHFRSYKRLLLVVVVVIVGCHGGLDSLVVVVVMVVDRRIEEVVDQANDPF